MLLEDVLTTAGEALRSANVLKEAGVEVVGIIGVVDREEGAEANATAAGYLCRRSFDDRSWRAISRSPAML